MFIAFYTRQKCCANTLTIELGMEASGEENSAEKLLICLFSRRHQEFRRSIMPG
jgi:hypothetical protein